MSHICWQTSYSSTSEVSQSYKIPCHELLVFRCALPWSLHYWSLLVALLVHISWVYIQNVHVIQGRWALCIAAGHPGLLHAVTPQRQWGLMKLKGGLWFFAERPPRAHQHADPECRPGTCSSQAQCVRLNTGLPADADWPCAVVLVPMKMSMIVLQPQSQDVTKCASIMLS